MGGYRYPEYIYIYIDAAYFKQKPVECPYCIPRTSALHHIKSTTMAGKRKKPPRKKSASSSTEISRRYPNKRERLLRRFYEPLVLLHTLGSTRGIHTKPEPSLPLDSSSVRDCRRGFLNELAYVCDYDKGGDTVTAIGLESTPQGSTFWVASNTSPAAKVIPFLKVLLQTLERIANVNAPSQGDKEDIAKLCIYFGSKRIKKYRSIFSRELEGCTKYIETNKETLGGLDLWLRRFSNSDPNNLVPLCQLAFEKRKSQEMNRLKELSAEPLYKTSKDAIHHKFSRLRHYIGRLGHHIRAANSLVSTAPNLRHILDGFSVRAITTPARAEWLPPIDEAAVREKTLLDKVLVRMLPAKSPQLEFYQQQLRKMDETTQISYRFLIPYTDPTIRPRVHAEIQVLEHFHEKGLQFEDSDRYIACSKPACYCCKLYFRHHPGSFEEPASHCKIYLNWRPPDVNTRIDASAANGEEDKDGQIRQRNILNAMIQDIRRDALHQIAEKQKPSNWHPDSCTGITSTAARLEQSTVVGSEWGGEIGVNDGGLSLEHGGSRANVASSATIQKIPESVRESDHLWIGAEGGLEIDQIPPPIAATIIPNTVESQDQFFRRSSCSTTSRPWSAGSINSPLGSFLEPSNSDDEEDIDDDGGVRLHDY
ncbi:hypothetical protein BDBG_08286 [Blastomyces gilchristii SLH14081]|uniref:Uncharacterized protein n=1 Tax=Blastomyces gilchristii (strain SLH14081) TaxID=559298 RepID=A0A179V0Z5_BLAGS|nr:uncharacterized protein BDBG_08286 [Blastomyces gilchristii SLH14081]OAT13011.1 hypothetical protein BDBG_08286 [Blastomyces gilchristii SLH14081]